MEKQKKELEILFKDNESNFKIAIVVDMWLTGFDVPSLATMYIFKPMRGHNLTHANRVYKDKEGGLIVDYVGIGSALKEAMKDFTKRDKENYSDTDISKTAYPKFVEKLEVCKDLFNGFDYLSYLHGKDKERADIISDGTNFILEPKILRYDKKEQSQKDVFIKEATLLKQAWTLCISLLSKEERYLFTFFEAIRVIVSKIDKSKKLSLKEINNQVN